MTWQVYLSGEIHTDWREEIEAATKAQGLDVIPHLMIAVL